MVDIAPSPTRVAPLSEREGYRARAETPSFPNSFCHDRQIDTLNRLTRSGSNVKSFSASYEQIFGRIIRMPRGRLAPVEREYHRPICLRHPYLYLNRDRIWMSPFQGYGIPLRRGSVDVGVQTQPLPEPTVRARFLIPQHRCV
jgi:hypothetical protein